MDMVFQTEMTQSAVQLVVYFFTMVGIVLSFVVGARA